MDIADFSVFSILSFRNNNINFVELTNKQHSRFASQSFLRSKFIIFSLIFTDSRLFDSLKRTITIKEWENGS